MAKDIIPPKDADFNILQKNVLIAMVANAVAWLIPNGVILALQALQTTWTNAYNTYLDPSLRTKGITGAKRAARKGYVKQLRPALKQYVQDNSAVTDTQRTNMGVKPRATTRTRVGVPKTEPQVDLKIGNGNQIRFHFKQGVDENGVSRRGKPDGVSRIVFAYKAVKVGDTAPASYLDCPNMVEAQRTPYLFTTNPAEAGMRLYVFAHWVNTRNEGGPWTADAATIIIPG